MLMRREVSGFPSLWLMTAYFLRRLRFLDVFAFFLFSFTSAMSLMISLMKVSAPTMTPIFPQMSICITSLHL